MSGEDNDATTSAGQGDKPDADSPESIDSGLVDQQDSLSRIAESDPDDSERQFRQTCEKINEIEERARHSLRSPDLEHRCSFCNRPSSQAGSLCQPDQLDVCICLQCAETALELLRKQDT